jgi:hypothetical protein
MCAEIQRAVVLDVSSVKNPQSEDDFIFPKSMKVSSTVLASRAAGPKKDVSVERSLEDEV